MINRWPAGAGGPCYNYYSDLQGLGLSRFRTAFLFYTKSKMSTFLIFLSKMSIFSDSTPLFPERKQCTVVMYGFL